MADVKRFLYSREGKDFLEQKYRTEGLSLREIAKAISSYAMEVDRAMVHHGIPRRDRSDAQRNAFEQGKIPPPITGPRPEKTKEAIGDGMRRAWLDGKFTGTKTGEALKKYRESLTPEELEAFNQKKELPPEFSGSVEQS